MPGESPWTEDPDGLQTMGSQRVRHNRETKHTHFTINKIKCIPGKIVVRLWKSKRPGKIVVRLWKSKRKKTIS